MGENATFPYPQKLPKVEAFDLPNTINNMSYFHTTNMYICSIHMKGILTSPGEDNQGLNRLFKKKHPGQLSLFRQISEKKTLLTVPWYSAG